MKEYRIQNTGEKKSEAQAILYSVFCVLFR